MIGRRERVTVWDAIRCSETPITKELAPTTGRPGDDGSHRGLDRLRPARCDRRCVACPNRPVWCLQADGSAMSTISALWTHAREDLDITTVIYNDSAYAILRMELMRVGTEMGVLAVQARTAEEFADALRRAQAGPGPHLIEAVVPPLAP